MWKNDSVLVILLPGGGISFQPEGRSGVNLLANGDVCGPDDMREHNTAFYSKNTFCVADAVKPGVSQQWVLVTSPKTKRYKELAKAPNVNMLGMPLWDERELKKLWRLRFSSVPESAWRGYYDRWGGVPRSVFDKITTLDQEGLDMRCTNVDIDSCMKWIGTDHYNSTEASGIVLHLHVTVGGEYKDIQVRFASLYVEQKVVKYYEKGMQKLIIKYIQDCAAPTFASTRGYLFEAVAHRMLTRGGKFLVCLLITFPARFLTSLIHC